LNRDRIPIEQRKGTKGGRKYGEATTSVRMEFKTLNFKLANEWMKKPTARGRENQGKRNEDDWWSPLTDRKKRRSAAGVRRGEHV